MHNDPDVLAPLAPLLGTWTADADSPIGKAQCTRQFAPVLGGAYVELIARWNFGSGRDEYEERALWGATANGALGFWSFTSDGGRATGELADVQDIHPAALGFIATMPAGRARQAYWSTADGALHWVVEAETPHGWERMVSHRYRRVASAPTDDAVPSTPDGHDDARAPSHQFTHGLDGWITHTDLASNDPDATKAWCAEVLGWRFTMDVPAPGGGTVHLFAYSEKGGGAVRPVSAPEIPGSIPYVHVEDAQAAFEKALRGGAEEMLAPTRVMDGVTVAIVRAPGGVPIGFSGP